MTDNTRREPAVFLQARDLPPKSERLWLEALADLLAARQGEAAPDF